MVYDTKNRILHMGVFEKVELTELEHKILICLSPECLITYGNMSNYLYGFKSKYSIHALKIGVTRIKQKTKNELRIKTIRSRGYLLETEMYFY